MANRWSKAGRDISGFARDPGGTTEKALRKAGGDISDEAKRAGKAVSDVWHSAPNLPEPDQEAFKGPRQISPGQLAAQYGAQRRGVTPTIAGAQIATGDQAGVRQRQMDLVKALTAQAEGKGPSLAQMQLKQGLEQGLKSQLAAVRSQRGASPTMAARQIAQSQADVGQQLASQGAMLRLQEQQAAQQALGQQLAGVRGTDIGLAEAQAQLAQRTQEANLAQQAQEIQDINNMIQFYESQGLSRELAQQQARQDYEMAKLGQKTAEIQGRQQLGRDILSGIGSGAMTYASMQGGGAPGSPTANAPTATSDRTAKKDIKDGKGVSKSFLDALKSYSYEYKNPKHGKGRFLSVMAQDLEKAGPVGKSMVKEVEGVKTVDYGKGFGAMLAAQADLNDRMSILEKVLKKKRGK